MREEGSEREREKGKGEALMKMGRGKRGKRGEKGKGKRRKGREKGEEGRNKLTKNKFKKTLSEMIKKLRGDLGVDLLRAPKRSIMLRKSKNFLCINESGFAY